MNIVTVAVIIVVAALAWLVRWGVQPERGAGCSKPSAGALRGAPGVCRGVSGVVAVVLF